ncbi:MAG: DUF438 domain-containing protein [Spirochaetota bacterium]
MSDVFQNDIEKQEQLKKIIKALHDGKAVTEVKKDFARLLRNVSPQEISEMEQSLIKEGFPPEEIQRLCEVHVDVFRGALKKEKKPHKLPGHPVHTHMLENLEAKKILKKLKPLVKKTVKGNGRHFSQFEQEFNNLKQITLHYTRKENQLFPYLEKHNFTGPSKVMWGKHDEIRALLKMVETDFREKNLVRFKENALSLISKIGKMMFMEERILFPTALKKLSDQEWADIRRGEAEIGYAWVSSESSSVKPGNLWDANLVAPVSTSVVPQQTDSLKLDTGVLTLEQVNMMLKALPLDISFVDENDKVLYYANNPERVFPRSPAVIGRAVQNCHPPKSLHLVEAILADFRKKERKEAEFWVNSKGRFLHIRYLPVYDAKGVYRGTLEITQDVTRIRQLEGEKRLLDS